MGTAQEVEAPTLALNECGANRGPDGPMPENDRFTADDAPLWCYAPIEGGTTIQELRPGGGVSLVGDLQGGIIYDWYQRKLLRFTQRGSAAGGLWGGAAFAIAVANAIDVAIDVAIDIAAAAGSAGRVREASTTTLRTGARRCARPAGCACVSVRTSGKAARSGRLPFWSGSMAAVAGMANLRELFPRVWTAFLADACPSDGPRVS